MLDAVTIFLLAVNSKKRNLGSLPRARHVEMEGSLVKEDVTGL
jgi:hypothetical protein